MLRIAICDDHENELQTIKTATEQFFQTHGGWEPHVDALSSGLLFLEQLENRGGWDIVLLDICMPGVLGTQIASEIRRRHDKTEIVFLTTSDEYAVDAFALKAAHYLLKPFTQAQFDEAMNRAIKRFADGVPKKITIRSESGELHNIDVNDIWFIESQDHQITVYTKEMHISESRRSLARLMEELKALSPRQFIAPYKGYIVNQKAIVSIEKENIILRNGTKIPIPKRDCKMLQDQYLDYLFRHKGTEGDAI